MSKAAMNLQDSFLNQVRRENSEVRILLVNGTLLRGVVKGFDNFTLILSNRNGQHLVYKHAIAQIVSHRPHQKSEDLSADSSPAAEDSITSEENSGELVHAGHSEPASSAPSTERKPGNRREPHRDRDKQPRAEASKPKKEGFNTLDLSGLKLGNKS